MQGYFRSRLQPYDKITVSEIGHHANLIPWLIVAEQADTKIVKWPLEETKQLSIKHPTALINTRARIIVISQMSNVNGEQPDIQAITKLVHQHNILVVADSAQGIVHRGLEVQALDIDFYVFSAHKLYGPTGLGICDGKIALLAEIAPCKGGKILTKANFSHFTAEAILYGFEAGKPNIARVLAFNAVIDWMKAINWQQAENYAITLTDYTELTNYFILFH
ncbi:aminotransferase class V-fold PLP-dependent enzyme [Arsenophonus sp. aPb]|nr:aminotransferase class V-fold PLP-dependent enzyme [Arsenophonus sp. aPb]WGL99651.1 aminotransferase class V-fold PLP-dependent enzyme [Arsenophonus sp. aPb]